MPREFGRRFEFLGAEQQKAKIFPMRGMERWKATTAYHFSPDCGGELSNSLPR